MENSETLKDLETFFDKALQTESWGVLLIRGNAWSSMRRNGILLDEAPKALVYEIETDLAEYGFSILRAALTYKEMGGDPLYIRKSFEVVGKVFEALTTNSAADLPERDFYKILAGSAYHLSGFSAMAYSIINYPEADNLTAIETALRLLILRDISSLKQFLEKYLTDPQHTDDSLALKLETDQIDEDELISSIINLSGCSALAFFEFALQTGSDVHLLQAKEILKKSIQLAIDSSNVTHYWILKLVIQLIDDLWNTSLHVNLPIISPIEGDGYQRLRTLFLANLYSRKNAEIELWPSQLEAARRSSDLSDDLVVALPTSAGKTRIAELTGLMTLSTGRRVLIVTPLRALSAQTERSFRSTFAPLGFKVSSLYGASGSSGDEDALRSNEIIISTPEKLDFALRSDPTIINDVGLVILDEGHLIGPNEREIRFEILVQKLLKRSDSDTRRIVCLSAILPTGKPLEDLTSWIRKDRDGEPITVPWRPTRQRFGTITFQGTSAKLNYGKTDSSGFISKFLEMNPTDDSPKLRSGALKDLTMTSAWRFASEGKRVLVFVTTADWVEGFGKTALELVKDGCVTSLVRNPDDIKRAVQIGEEWLGARHPVVEALKIGIAIHHGKLPSPFLRELELLLSQGKILLTVASPTLSQGLNINAAVLLVPYLIRSKKKITGEEFANVAGRAGRAFVDVEGLVLHVIHDKVDWRKKSWFDLVQSARERNLESGILQVINDIILRLSEKGILNKEDAFEYLANSTEGWKGLTQEQSDLGETSKPHFQTEHSLEMLDAMVFGLVEALESDAKDLHVILETALRSSLWDRQMRNKDTNLRKKQQDILVARAKLIWKKTTPQIRRGHFAMGVGLEAGLKIDELAINLTTNLDRADKSALEGDFELLLSSIISLAEDILEISPFKPDKELPNNWKDLLGSWISGASIDFIGNKDMKFIEDVFIYKLVWAMESIRVRRLASGWESEHLSGTAAACLETGTYRYETALLVRAGLPSRIAAIQAIESTDGLFSNASQLRDWLRSARIDKLSKSGDWPTSSTTEIWNVFRDTYLKRDDRPLMLEVISTRRLRKDTHRPANGMYRIITDEQGVCELRTPDFKYVGQLKRTITRGSAGMMHAIFSEESTLPTIVRIGSGQLSWSKLD